LATGDYVEIRDGNDETDVLLHYLFNSTKPRLDHWWTSSGLFLWVRFKSSNEYKALRGFKMQIQFVKIPKGRVMKNVDLANACIRYIESHRRFFGRWNFKMLLGLLFWSVWAFWVSSAGRSFGEHAMVCNSCRTKSEAWRCRIKINSKCINGIFFDWSCFIFIFKNLVSDIDKVKCFLGPVYVEIGSPYQEGYPTSRVTLLYC